MGRSKLVLLNVKTKIGNGDHTSFWNDVWLLDKPFRETFLRLFPSKKLVVLILVRWDSWWKGLVDLGFEVELELL